MEFGVCIKPKKVNGAQVITGKATSDNHYKIMSVGPMKIMKGKHNEIRELLRAAFEGLILGTKSD